MDKDVDENKEKALDINDFPHYLSTKQGLSIYPPQVYALADLLGVSPTASLKQQYDQVQ